MQSIKEENGATPMLTEEMRRIITDYSAGMVATINADGSPSVSPKATFVIIDDATLAFGNLRSPGTIANLARNPSVEVCFLDILARRAVRVSGKGRTVRRDEAEETLLAAFENAWSGYEDRMTSFVRIDIAAVELILSPAYDIGTTEAELREANLAKLNSL